VSERPSLRGPWSPGSIDAFLRDAAIPIRLACNGESGHPVLASLWFAPGEPFASGRGTLWCATQRDARVARLLARDARCAFEIAGDRPPYRGVRGQAAARLVEARGEPVLRTLIERYLDDPDCGLARWLLDRADTEVAIALEPRTLFSWDYEDRMGPG